MPPVSRFGGGNRAKKKQSIIEKLKAFFEKYFGIGNRSFTSDSERHDEGKKKVIYFAFSAPPIGMVAEKPAQYGTKKDNGE